MRKMNKCLTVIGVFLVLLVGCKVPPTSPRPSPRGEVEACRPLAEIDTLLWQQPDSAFALLRHFAASPQADSLDEYNTHYFHLLLAELLYKNDCAQSNRPNVLQAVDYYDGHCGPDPQSSDPCGDQAFLAARAHYINGVGYYERDSIVQACEEYLKALEVMESNYKEEELVGKKAKFMAYLNNRLGELFSGQYMMESAIECFAKSYEFSLIDPISPYSPSNSFYYIGLQYDKLNKKDSAYYYYKRAIETLPDTNNLLYRDLESSCALLSYQMGKNASIVLQQLYKMLQLAPDKGEWLTRCLAIGAICFEEKRYDSALFYLELVYRNTTDMTIRIQSADYLRIICDSLEMKEQVDEYIRFIAINKKTSGQNKAEVSQLSSQYKEYKDKKLERQLTTDKAEVRKRTTARTLGIVVPIALVITLLVILLIRKRHRKSLSEKEAEKELLQNANASLQTQLIQQREALEAGPHKAPATAYEALMKEIVCIHLVQRIRSVEIITTNKPSVYADYAASTKERRDLISAVEKNCPDFGPLLKAQCPSFTKNDFELCRYLLIGILEPQVAVLLQKDYSTVWKRAKEIKVALQTEEPAHRLRHILFEDPQ